MKDFKKLYRELDRYRKSENLSWRKLGTQVGVAPCTFTRLKAGRGVNVENYVKLNLGLGKHLE